MGFNIENIRKDFPILSRTVYDRPLVYLDNAATTQKPKAVIERISEYYRMENCNIHRGVHYLSQHATDAFENARKTVATHLNARMPEEIIFTKGTTEAINLVAQSLGRKILAKDDEIVITGMEHHSNIVPWQLLAGEKEAVLNIVPFNEQGDLDLNEYRNLLSERTRIVAISHVSNVLGTVNPVRHMIEIAHQKGIPVLVDGAQSVPHMPVDVQDLDCDFFCFSGHKVYGPMGVGVLYGKKEVLEIMSPYQGGGEMVDQVSFEKTTFNELPFRFEAGTPDVAAVLGLETALNYVNDLGLGHVSRYEEDLLSYATLELLNIPGLRIFGTSENKSSVISFLLEGIHPYDVGTLLDKMGVAVRTGHHCAQPVMDKYGIPGTVRVAFSFYNTGAEVDILVNAVQKARKMLG